MTNSPFEKSADAVNQKLEYLILQKYANAEDINSDDFKRTFEIEFPPFLFLDAYKVLQYLHGSDYLESAPGKYHTLKITAAGMNKYKLEKEAFAKRGRFTSSNQGFKSHVDKEEFALKYIDLLFPYFPNDLPFYLNDIIRDYSVKNNITYEDTLAIKEVDEWMKNLLIKKEFVQRVGSTLQIELTERGKLRKREIISGNKSYNLLEDREALQKPIRNTSRIIMNIVRNSFVRWIVKYIVEIIIGGIIAGILTAYFIAKYKLPH